MNRKGFAPIIVLFFVVGFLVIGGAYYFATRRAPQLQSLKPSVPIANTTSTTASSPPTSSAESSISTSSTKNAIAWRTIAPSSSFPFSCPQDSSITLTAYEDPGMGIAFCYPPTLEVATGSITWPQTYHDSSYGKEMNPTLSFYISHTGMPVVGGISQCQADGPGGSDTCLPPQDSQIVRGMNSNGLNYVIYRSSFINNHNGTTTVFSSSSGPYAYFPFAYDYYLVIQAHAPAALPSYVDSDLKTIIDTVAVAPQTYVATSTDAGFVEDLSTMRISLIKIMARASGNISLHADLNGIPNNMPGLFVTGDNLNQWMDIDPAKIDFNKLKVMVQGGAGTGYVLELVYTTDHTPYTNDRGVLRVSTQDGGPMPTSGQQMYNAFYSSSVPMFSRSANSSE